MTTAPRQTKRTQLADLRPKYGFRVAIDGRTLEATDETEAKVLGMIVELMTFQNIGNKAIAGRLNRSGIDRRGDDWTADDIKVIRRRVKRGLYRLRPTGA